MQGYADPSAHACWPAVPEKSLVYMSASAVCMGFLRVVLNVAFRIHEQVL